MTRPSLRLAQPEPLSPDIVHWATVFASPAGAGRRYALGRNEHSLVLAEAFDVDCFIDDYADAGTTWHDRPVVTGEAAPADAIVVNCAMSIRPTSAHRRMEKRGVASVLAYADVCGLFPDRLALPRFVSEMRDDVLANHSHWESLREALGDAESRRVFDDVCDYRLTGDYRHMAAYQCRFGEQYFESFLGLGAGEVFVDGGGFDGDTAEAFCTRYPDYDRVILFEPSPSSMAAARGRLRGRRDVDFRPQALSGTEGQLSFAADAGPASAVGAAGPDRVLATTLDHAVRDRVTMVKMDLEGWELEALEGSRAHVQEDHPKLAICVYHKASHFWRVFESVFGMRRDYDVLLRHYSEGWSETVMYFIPT